MNKIFPDEFQKYFKLSTTKAAFYSDIKPQHPRDCKNCGGVGTMIIFVANGGPFLNVPSGIAHFHKDRWWAGKNYEEMCPVCKGNGIDPKYVEQPARQYKLNIDKVVKNVDKLDYTDV